MHLLPELAESQEALADAIEGGLGFLEDHVYPVVLVRHSAFYGLERLAASLRGRQRKAGKGDSTSQGMFWLHISSFAIYNAIVGYLLLHREAPGLQNLFLFSVAMALHFLATDHGLRVHHKGAYLGIGRWVLAGAVLLGWVIGLSTEISEVALAVMIAFLAGGVVLNVLEEELPKERESRFWAFALGAAIDAPPGTVRPIDERPETPRCLREGGGMCAPVARSASEVGNGARRGGFLVNLSGSAPRGRVTPPSTAGTAPA